MKTIVFSSAILAIGLGLSSLTNVEKMPSDAKINKQINEQFGFVKAGLVNMGTDTNSVQSFLFSKTEITNGEYQLFLNELLANGEHAKYAIAKIDSSKWNTASSLNEKYTQHYHSHVAYKDFPVVNITKEGAQLYCEWLTKKYNALLPEGQQLIFRLPLKAEWMRAACGDDLYATYTWKGPYLRNSQGNFLANFVRVGETSIARNEKGELVIKNGNIKLTDYEEHADVIAPAKSYYPNEFGIYNMNGNVAELLADQQEVIGGSWYDGGYDIRNQSVKKYNGTSPTVGFRVVATVKPSDVPWLKIKS
jgi:formylglycine-generating enzyme required for sulfatase activity